MHEYPAQSEGNLVTQSSYLQSFAMPAETVAIGGRTSTEVPRGESGVGSMKNGEKRSIKEERDFERDNASLLYTLAAAAASRTSAANLSVKKEAKTPSTESRSTPTHDTTPPTVKLEGAHQTFEDRPSKVVHSAQNDRRDVGIPSTQNSECLNASQRLLVGEASEEISQNSAATHASQLHLMEAMMQRQRQLYEEYGNNNWMKMQRNDRNCLSKSKAKRYRWCVQKNQEHENTNDSLMTTTMAPTTTDFTNKKKNPMKRPSTNPMHDKLYGTVFTGASKFRCRDCGKSFTTLVDLTVHMSKTGHYRDQNLEPELKGCSDASKFVKPKKRSMVEMEEKESAEKVLKCLGCGHSFESLQDLTVHMIKTKHYEDVTSLRLYNQKNDFPTSSVSASHSSAEDKQTTTSLHASNGAPPEFPLPDMADGLKYPPASFDPAAMNFLGSGVIPPGLGSHPNFANMLSMAALRLLGGFPPYFMQMPFPNAMNGYDMASAAYATAAARLFLSSPWLPQMPGLASGSIFPQFLNPHTPLPPTMLSQTRQQSPIAGDVPAQQTSTHSTASSRGSNRPSSTSSQTPNGSTVDSNDALDSKSKVLRCVQCGETFSSLQKMTDHMRETTHFPIAMTPPADEMNQRRVSRCSSNSDSITRGSPQSKSSPQHSAVPSSSPLEQLAKLACGKTLIAESSPSRTKQDVDIHAKMTSSSPVSSKSPSRRQSPISDSFTSDSYIRPGSPQKSEHLPRTGFDFIKSLESTIQSAISRVNQPTKSSSLERQIQSSQKQQPRTQKSRKHHILNACLPSVSAAHRKSLPDHCQEMDSTAGLARGRKGSKEMERPASDGEEHYMGAAKSYAIRKSIDICSQKDKTGSSPPLDLSKSACSKSSQNGIDIPMGEVRIDGSSADEKPAAVLKNPIQCIKDEMQSLFEMNSRKVKEGANKRARSPPSSQNLSRPQQEREDCPSKKIARISRDGPEDNPLPPAKSNPLKEMQKIINATEMTIRDNRGAFSQLNNGSSVGRRKTETEIHKQDQSRTFEPRSVLSDLVRHDDDVPPAINPLAQMENLVNLKIGQNSHEKSPLHSRKSTFSKIYSPLSSEGASTPRNGTNPMSALLNLFTGNSAITQTHPSKGDRPQGRKPTQPDVTENGKKTFPAKNSEVGHGKELDTTANDTDKLKEKMTEFFRSMFAQTQPPHLERKADKTARQPTQPIKLKRGSNSGRSHCDGSTSGTLTVFHELQLQKLFSEHFGGNLNDTFVPDSALESLSMETGLPVASIKEWVLNTKELIEKSQCGFVEVSESSLTFRCTSCAVKSAQGLSARDFLHHLSTHISTMGHSRSPKRRYSEDELDIPHRKEWEMLYSGAMHFKPLNAEESSSTISLTARVSESPLETTYSASPELEIAAEKRKRVEVVEDSPIKVSG